MVPYFISRNRFLVQAGNLRSCLKQRRCIERGTTFRTMATTKPGDSLSSASALLKNQSNQIINNTSTNSYQKQRRTWYWWTGYLLRWAPVGFCVFGAIEWQVHRYKVQKEEQLRIASDFQAKVYCSLPLRILSRCWGWLAGCYIPTYFRPYVYGLYSSAFNVNLDEAKYSDLKHYRSLAEFFTRPLKNGVRFIDPESQLVSPADGRVLHFGTAANSMVEQVKGINYRIEEFLGPPNWIKDKSIDKTSDYAQIICQKNMKKTALFQCVIYLAPGDYHRFHSPANWEPQIRRHFTGELLSVSPRIASWLPNLFCVNERALYLGKWIHGFFSFTAVGATNVGSVQIYVDENLKTNRWVGLKVGAYKTTYVDYEEMTLPPGTKLEKGDILGQFNMGSTVVLLFEAPVNFKFDIQQGQTIRMGESLGHT